MELRMSSVLLDASAEPLLAGWFFGGGEEAVGAAAGLAVLAVLAFAVAIRTGESKATSEAEGGSMASG